jgi:hypothetical protein
MNHPSDRAYALVRALAIRGEVQYALFGEELGPLLDELNEVLAA